MLKELFIVHFHWCRRLFLSTNLYEIIKIIYLQNFSLHKTTIEEKAMKKSKSFVTTVKMQNTVIHFNVRAPNQERQIWMKNEWMSEFILLYQFFTSNYWETLHIVIIWIKLINGDSNIESKSLNNTYLNCYHNKHKQ